jgi:hypothetical protein
MGRRERGKDWGLETGEKIGPRTAILNFIGILNCR